MNCEKRIILRMLTRHEPNALGPAGQWDNVPISSRLQASASRGKPHAVFHMLRVSVPSACLGKNLRSKVFHCAKLRDGTRDSVLALTHMQSFAHAVHQRTLAEHGYVPVRRSVQDFCDSWKITCSPTRRALRSTFSVYSVCSVVSPHMLSCGAPPPFRVFRVFRG